MEKLDCPYIDCPCIDCITLSICKTKIEDPTVFTFDYKRFRKISCECDLLYDYLYLDQYGPKLKEYKALRVAFNILQENR